ncbi:hypothetical protein BUALT_Bualt03G0175400 [Buddleja alternifolia]|uniref:Myb-like domain-containing protein n=1 Tax=Buddleja alternifolia TaxID=168488 RepID=A0AAV6Y2Q3_9LAMI|nr:hypothetical protein BUALT_Bualt03G0175400 [Buddleja alternifolia]
MDWSEKTLCIKCNEGGNLLVCSENGCPLAIHGGCMGCPARFDDEGHFYCPYCLYKQAVADSRQAREIAMERKNALLIFMGEDSTGTEERFGKNKRAEAKLHIQSKVSAPNVNKTTCDDGKRRRNSDAFLNQSTQRGDKHIISDSEEEEEIQEVESETSSGSKGTDTSLGTQELEKNSNAEEEKIQEAEMETSSASSGEDPSFTVRERSKRAKAVSTKSRLFKQSVKNKQKSKSVNTPGSTSQRSSSALKTDEVLDEEVETPGRDKDTLGSGKRKRSFWREEEEVMLKAGVKKFSSKVNKNLPWKKILDLGRDVFDGSRSPSDLKDKWRNMLAK